MRLILTSCLLLILAAPAVRAQSIGDNAPGYESDMAPVIIPPDAPAAPTGDPYTVSDVSADVTADTAGHARDQALMQAERAAFAQLCARLNAPDSAAKLSDDAVAALVQSFEVQSERVSAVRYIGVFTIRFKPGATQKKLGRYAPASVDANGNAIAGEPGRNPAAPVTHLPIAVYTESLAAWTQIKRRLTAVPQVARVDTIDLGRGLSHMDLSYTGTLADLENGVTLQGFVLRQQTDGDWELSDNSMVPR